MKEAANLEERFLEMSAPQNEEKRVEDDEIPTPIEERSQEVETMGVVDDAPALDVAKTDRAGDG